MKLPHFLFIVLLLASLSLRLVQIETNSEFLGDQGRTMLHLLTYYQTGTLPLVGPTVLTGEHLGPFFYYVLMPVAILSGFDPVAMGVFMAILGTGSVVLLYFLGWRLWGAWTGLGVAALYAFVSKIIIQDMTLWEPNLVPFFVFLYLLALHMVITGTLRGYILMGFAVSALVQLHYPNLLFLPATLAFVCFMAYRWRRDGRNMKSYVLWVIAGFLTGLAILLPFLYFEFQNGFQNIGGILGILLSQGSPDQVFSKRMLLRNFMDYSSRVYSYVLPVYGPINGFWIFTVLAGYLFIFKRNFWTVFLVMLTVSGISAMSLYRGVVYNHYLLFLVPIGYILLGYCIESLRRFVPVAILGLCLLALVSVRLLDYPETQTQRNDLRRVEKISREIARQSAGEPYAYTIASGRSFSDMHYRFFLVRDYKPPVNITENSYTQLFIVCDESPCRNPQKIRNQREIEALCYEDNCQGTYPTIPLDTWELSNETEIERGILFTYRKR